MTNELESKFGEEMENHPRRWVSRMLFEPMYLLRNSLAIPKEEPIKTMSLVGVAETMRLGLYCFIGYEAANYFLR